MVVRPALHTVPVAAQDARALFELQQHRAACWHGHSPPQPSTNDPQPACSEGWPVATPLHRRQVDARSTYNVSPVIPHANPCSQALVPKLMGHSSRDGPEECPGMAL